MSITLKITLVIITIIYMFLILKSIKSKKINVSYSILWIITGIILIISAIIPNMIEWISMKLGFETTSNMLFCITIFIIFYLIFNLTTIISEENKKNTLLIQEISLLKNKVSDLEEELNETKSN